MIGGARVSRAIRVGGFCCPAPPEPRLPNHLGSEGHFIIVGTYTSSPITAEPYRAKEQPLHVRRSYFAPASKVTLLTSGVEAPGTAPGSGPLITQSFIA